MDAYDYLKEGYIKVWEKSYSVVKARYVPDLFFAVVQDFNEITVIVDVDSVDPDWVLLEEKPWKILTFDVALPFDLVGFLAVVADALSKAMVSVFALSAFSTDHFLVKEEDLPRALEALQKLGAKLES